MLRGGDILMLIGYQASLSQFRELASRGRRRGKTTKT